MLATAWHVLDMINRVAPFQLVHAGSPIVLNGTTADVTMFRLLDETWDLGLIGLKTPQCLITAEEMVPVAGLSLWPSVGEDLGWFGFPGSMDGQGLFCRGYLGAIQSVSPGYVVIGRGYPGMSGAAVFNEKGHVIGLMSALLGQAGQNSDSLLVVAPIQAVRVFMEQNLRASVMKHIPTDWPRPNA